MYRVLFLIVFPIALVVQLVSLHEAKRSSLNDRTSLLCLGRFRVVSMLKCDCEAARLAARVGELTRAVRAADGEVDYIGRAVSVAVVSKQLPTLKGAGAVDLVVLSSWGSRQEYEKFKVSGLKGWKSHHAQGFNRNAVVNAMVPVGLSALWVKTKLLGQQHDIEKEAAGELVAVKCNVKLKAMQDFGELFRSDGSPPDEPVMIWNWLKQGTAEQASSDFRYGVKMMEMLSQHGGGLMHVGSAVNMSDSDGQFDSIAAVMYPGRSFMRKLMHSQWMYETVQGKQPGDSLAVATTPFYKADSNDSSDAKIRSAEL